MPQMGLPDTGDVGFYVQRIWPWGGIVARASIAVGLATAVTAAWLVRDELKQSEPAQALAVVAIGTAVAGLVSGKSAKDYVERVAKVLTAAASTAAVFYAAGIFHDSGISATELLAAALMAVALHLVVYGGASLTFQAAVEEGDGSLRTWTEVADHPDRPTLKPRMVGVWELLTGPVVFATFPGILATDLARPWLYVFGVGALYALHFTNIWFYLDGPRLVLTPMVTRAEAEHHLRSHGAVADPAGLLRVAWKRPDTFRRASLPRRGPYRLSAVRRVCRRLDVPEPRSEFELEERTIESGGGSDPVPA